MKTLHTPGPWFLGEGTPWKVLDANGQYIVNTDTHRRTYKECVANAQLICAAPDLLAALKATLEMLLAWHKDFPEHVGDKELPVIALSRAAIAKAEKQ